MSREIKFRAWDISNKRMYSHEELLDGEQVNPSVLIDCLTADGTGYDTDTVLLQYTNLKDKNGKEIYEGDILKTVGENQYPEYSGVSDVIFGKDLQWQVRSGREYEHGLPLTWGGWESLEVIGNIYENPELLS